MVIEGNLCSTTGNFLLFIRHDLFLNDLWVQLGILVCSYLFFLYNVWFFLSYVKSPRFGKILHRWKYLSCIRSKNIFVKRKKNKYFISLKALSIHQRILDWVCFAKKQKKNGFIKKKIMYLRVNAQFSRVKHR